MVEKRCDCGEDRWTKCGDAWYMKKWRYGGQSYEPNITRYAIEVLGLADAVRYRQPFGVTGTWRNTKTEAETVAEMIKLAVRGGAYVSAKRHRPTPAVAVQAAQGQAVEILGKEFYLTCIKPDSEKRRNSKVNDKAILFALYRGRTDDGKPFGKLPMAQMTTLDLIRWRGTLTALANSTWNKYRTLIGQFFRWATEQGKIPTNPLTTATKDQLKLLRRQKARQRSRRVDDTEFAAVLAAAKEARDGRCASRLYAILVTLIETGCRIGELLALQWADVDLAARLIFIRAEEVGAGKTGDPRSVEMSEAVAALLPALRIDPAGQELGRTKYVFGDEYGEQVKSIDRAWHGAVLRAHGYTPTYTPGTNDFDAATRAKLDEIDLHIHDLRHEAGCRWLESGYFDIAQVQARYGHKDLKQTSTYVHPRAGSIRQSQQAYDANRGFVSPPPATARGTNRVPSGDKVGTNRRVTKGDGQDLKLVKGHKGRN